VVSSSGKFSYQKVEGTDGEEKLRKIRDERVENRQDFQIRLGRVF